MSTRSHIVNVHGFLFHEQEDAKLCDLIAFLGQWNSEFYTSNPDAPKILDSDSFQVSTSDLCVIPLAITSELKVFKQ